MAISYRKILVPLDGSKLAECVLPHVEALAKECRGGEVILVRVVEPVVLPTMEGYAPPQREWDRLEAENREMGKRYLDEVKGRVQLNGAGLSTQLLFGRSAETIVDYAKDNSVDLIVIATHGRSGIGRWVWGSVADRILRSACVPVFMVRAPGCVPGM